MKKLSENLKEQRGESFNYLKLIPLIIIFVFNTNGWSQLVVSNTLTPQYLVDSVLVGYGITATNITYSGDSVSKGYFTGITNLGLQSGVLLTSGNVNIAPGPNNSDSAGKDTGLGGDADLTDISSLYSPNGFPIPTFDHCVLEFDFIPKFDKINLEYVLASEEYHEYANSQVNDVFAMFISGPGIIGDYSSPPGFPDGSKNIALLPGSTIGVSINTINNGTSNTGPCLNCQYLIHNAQNLVQYDAWTTTFTAWTTVIPNLTYHIKIAIADGGDHVFDSGVFLEENSFISDSVAMDTVFTMVDSVSGIAGNSIWIPVRANNFGEVCSFSHQLIYDPAVLAYNGFSSINTKLVSGFTANISVGKVGASYKNGNSVLISDGEILYKVVFIYKGGNTCLEWDLSSPGNNTYSNIYGDEIPSTWINGCVDVYSSIEDKSNSPQIFIFPNPSNTKVFISNVNIEAIQEANIYNQSGQKVLHKTGIKNSIDISELSKGIYIIELITDKLVWREKLIIN